MEENDSTKNSRNYSAPKTEALVQLRRTADAAERTAAATEQIAGILSSFAGASLDAAYPYGDGVTSDRWSRRRPRRVS